MKNPISLFRHKSNIALYLCILILTFYVLPVQASVVFNEDFETGIGTWTIDNGVWEIGTPTSGPASIPGSAYSPTNCMATILDGSYPYGPGSRLISPEIDVPAVAEGEEVLLRFMEHYTYSP
ncbi:MAG: hypothetical protein GY931_22025, partial [Maribacter sp.]|nr:hypothetical protein [Maribacter sp.]